MYDAQRRCDADREKRRRMLFTLVDFQLSFTYSLTAAASDFRWWNIPKFETLKKMGTFHVFTH